MRYNHARDSRQFAERHLASLREFVDTHPDAIPELYDGYKDEVQDVISRFYVPEVRVADGVMHATAPKRHRNNNAIGFMAAYSGQGIIIDNALIQPSKRQAEHHQKFLRTHRDMGANNDTRSLVANAIITETLTAHLSDSVIAQSFGNSYAPGIRRPFVDREGKLSYVAFKTMSPLVLNMDMAQDTATLIHEVDHILENDGMGMGPDDLIAERAAIVTSEQRGYYVATRVADYLIAHSLDMPPDFSDRVTDWRQVEDIRIQNLGEGPQFGCNSELIQTYTQAGLIDFMLPHPYQKK